MIKIKTKRLKENEHSEYIGIDYKTKDSNTYEHLVLINHLLQEILKTKEYTKDELLRYVKTYLG